MFRLENFNLTFVIGHRHAIGACYLRYAANTSDLISREEAANAAGKLRNDFVFPGYHRGHVDAHFTNRNAVNVEMVACFHELMRRV